MDDGQGRARALGELADQEPASESISKAPLWLLL